MRAALLACCLLLVACTPKPPAKQTLVGGQAVDLRELSPADVAAGVVVTPRGNDVFFQAPPIQTSKLIDLHRAGKEMGLALGSVERVRFGYLFGVLNRSTGALASYLLFQSNFVEGSQRYASVTLDDGTPLQFTVRRAEDPCVPNCYPVIEALIVTIPDAVLRAQQPVGLPLIITLTDGQVIRTAGSPAYVAGYLQVVDRYQR
ncbi:MAG: hypothetical protein SF182_13525 [Deltaproteobacteria bacterium]|nr:hypothetical protein [Deltaproteobacteria bacterium]